MCIYAQEYNDEKTPVVDWDYLNIAISNQALEGLKIMVDKKLQEICEPFETIVDAYSLHNMQISASDPFGDFSPNKVENNGRFTACYYKNLENTPNSNWIVLSTTLLDTKIYFYQKES